MMGLPQAYLPLVLLEARRQVMYLLIGGFPRYYVLLTEKKTTVKKTPSYFSSIRLKTTHTFECFHLLFKRICRLFWLKPVIKDW